MMNEAQHYKAVMNGRRSKAAGEYWENMIEAACQHYRLKGIAEITKTPEPMRPIKSLGRHMKLGAECFVMVSFGFEQYFKIPWAVFREMKQHYGRKYITPEDVQEYKVRYIGGILQFL